MQLRRLGARGRARPHTGVAHADVQQPACVQPWVARACAGKPVQNYRGYMAELHDIDGHDVSQILSAKHDHLRLQRFRVRDCEFGVA
jgi:hypothetical protein